MSNNVKFDSNGKVGIKPELATNEEELKELMINKKPTAILAVDPIMFQDIEKNIKKDSSLASHSAVLGGVGIGLSMVSVLAPIALPAITIAGPAAIIAAIIAAKKGKGEYCWDGVKVGNYRLLYKMSGDNKFDKKKEFIDLTAYVEDGTITLNI